MEPKIPEGFERVMVGLLRAGDLLWEPAVGRWRTYDPSTFLRKWKAEECYFVVRKKH